MSTKPKQGKQQSSGGSSSSSSGERRARRVSKKEQIIALYVSGMSEVEDLAIITGSRPSYVGSVLQEAGLINSYFDLYTSSNHPMNVYSKFFAGKLGFKDEAAAQASVELIDKLYGQFEFAEDRAGQHHALMMALVMFDRARWTGKGREADIFRRWLTLRLEEADLTSNSETDAGDDEASDDANNEASDESEAQGSDGPGGAGEQA
ncbi:MAG: hypothetical protein QOF02_874 [Blastocatellia bacterium]|jgi:hypothetical protein|nr:hypothetical protein [Blastocatellia bacterium]